MTGREARFRALDDVFATCARAAVACSGGVLQNAVFTEALTRRLRAEGFTVLLHRQVPPNDGGIALGQVAVAAALVAREHDRPAD